MTIDLKESLFRFIIPPSLFWGIFLLSNPYFFDPPLLIIILFIASGFVISAIGALITECINKVFKPVWLTPKGELEHWERLSKHEYIRTKIERVWNFYTMSLNSIIALLLQFLFPHCFFKEVLILVIVIFVFVILAYVNYKKVYQWGRLLKQINGLDESSVKLK